jgi:hypothetical protein
MGRFEAASTTPAGIVQVPAAGNLAVSEEISWHVSCRSAALNGYAAVHSSPG